jgi:hypothetical protein
MAITGRFVADFSNFQAAVQKAELSLRGLETGAGKVGASLNRMADQFSGRKLIQDAALAAEAVERIGGATKLTENEQAKLNALLTEGIAKYRALGLEVPKGMQDLANQTNRVVKEAEKLKPAADSGALSFKSLFGAFSLANIAGQAVGFVTAEVGKFIEAGGKLPAIQQSFSKLTAGIGQNSQEMLASLRTGTRGMVSELDLMQSSNKAILLGLPVTAKSMGELSSAATALGKAMGQDATKSLDDLITALGRSSPLILDNLGLTVKVGEANEAYAAKLGKTVEQLTDAEKKMAFYEAAMEAARKKTAELGEQTKTLGEIASTVWTHVGNAVTQGVSVINVGLGKALSSLRDFALFSEELIKLGPGMAIANAAARAEFEKMRHVAKDINLELPKVKANVDQVGKSLKVTADQSRSSVEDTKRLTDAFREFGITLDRAISPESRARAIANYEKSITKLSESVEVALARIQMDKVLKDGIPVIDGIATGIQGIGKYVEIAVPKIVTLADTIKGNLRSAIEGIPEIFKNAFTGGGGFLGALKAIGVQIADALTKPLIAKLGGALANLLLGAKGGGGLTSLLGGAAGPALGGLFGGGAAAGASAAGAAAIANASAAVTGGVGASAGLGGAGAAAGIGGSLAIGAATAGIGAAAVGVYFLIKSMNDGRKAVKQFAESFGGFDKLHEQLATLGDEGERLWVNLTQKVANGNKTQAEAAIQAIHDALAKHAEDAQVIEDAHQDALAKITDQYSQTLSDIESERKNLMGRIDAEMPEEIMGIQEQLDRARVDQLDKDKAAIEEKQRLQIQAVEEALKKAEGDAKKFLDLIKGIFSEGVELPIYEKRVPDGTVPTSGPYVTYPEWGMGNHTPPPEWAVPSFATGTGGRYVDFGRGTLAMLHGREKITAEGSSREQLVTQITVEMDGQRTARAVVRHLPGEVVRLGLS